jgi:small-conductance mechanosensitive channel
MVDPAPQAVFEMFGDSTLQFRLYAWVAVPQRILRINHELHMRIERLFRERGIAIDFPQRDVHLFPTGPIDVRLASAGPVVGPQPGGADRQSAVAEGREQRDSDE